MLANAVSSFRPMDFCCVPTIGKHTVHQSVQTLGRVTGDQNLGSKPHYTVCHEIVSHGLNLQGIPRFIVCFRFLVSLGFLAFPRTTSPLTSLRMHACHYELRLKGPLDPRRLFPACR